MALPPEDLFARQERDLQRFSNARAAQVLRYLEIARREISGIIADEDSFTAQRIASLSAQIDQAIAQLQRDVVSIGPSTTDLAKMSQRHLEQTIRIIAGMDVSISMGVLNLQTMTEFSMNELAHCTTLIEAEKQVIKSVLFTKVGVLGENPRKVAKQLTGPDSQFAKRYNNIENILRTETSHVYNGQSLKGLQYANETYGLELNKKIVETIDFTRNNPISLVLNGQVQAPDKKFKASVSLVKSKASMLKKSAGGIFWPIENGFYTGQRLPAHYRERGIVVPTDEPVNAP
jgi:hypothetical protein